jgi:hypothetical protein
MTTEELIAFLQQHPGKRIMIRGRMHEDGYSRISDEGELDVLTRRHIDGNVAYLAVWAGQWGECQRLKIGGGRTLSERESEEEIVFIDPYGDA